MFGIAKNCFDEQCLAQRTLWKSSRVLVKHYNIAKSLDVWSL